MAREAGNSAENDGRQARLQAFSSLSVLNHVAVGVYSVDAAGRCMQINTAALDLLGYAEEECLGRDMHELVHHRHLDGSSYPEDDCPLYQARRTGTPVFKIEEVMWTKTGDPVRVSCSSVPLADSAGGGTVITLNDVTSWREAEDRLLQNEQEQKEILRQRDAAARVEHEAAALQRQSVATVERAAAEQLREQQRLTEERLVQSEKLASVGRLAASISHEINNPLEAVTNLLYLARHDTSISAEANGYLEQAEQELARVSEIVAQTLRFQRSGGTLSDCSPAALVDSVVALHQGRLHHSGIQIQRQHRGDRKSFRCAEGDVRQILNNLISNAIDALQGGGTIAIRTKPARHPGTGAEGVRISISDSGHGMSRSVASRIFEPFYTTKGTKGSGLGLWISSSIAKRHGGHLRVRSCTEKGRRGTTFSLFLPDLRAA